MDDVSDIPPHPLPPPPDEEPRPDAAVDEPSPVENLVVEAELVAPPPPAEVLLCVELSSDNPPFAATVGVSSPTNIVFPSGEVGSPSDAVASPVSPPRPPAVSSSEPPPSDPSEAPVMDALEVPARDSSEASAIETLAEALMEDTIEAPTELSVEAPVTDTLVTADRDSVETSIDGLEEAALTGKLEVLARDSVEALATDILEAAVEVPDEPSASDSLEEPAEFSDALATDSLEAPVANDLQVLLTDSVEAAGTDPVKVLAIHRQADVPYPSADSRASAASLGGLPVGDFPVAADSEALTSSLPATISPSLDTDSSLAMESEKAAAETHPDPMSSSPSHFPGDVSILSAASPPLVAKSPPPISPSLADDASHAVNSPTTGQDISIRDESGLLDAVEMDGLENNVGEYGDFPPVNEPADAGVMMDAQEYDEGLVAGEHADISAGKRKRGRPSRALVKAPSKRKEEEDVCFICFDGGDLVLCDRRGCPKAYHPTCVNRDEAFFRSKGKWNCGWHICSNCEKAAQYMCYTCTFSLCKGCMKNSEFFCIRGNKGLCETCMVTVMHLESSQQESKDLASVDFDDKNNWEYLFKEYWLNLKRKLSMTFTELTKAKNFVKGSGVSSLNEESSDDLYDANKDPGMSSDSSLGPMEESKPAKKKAKKRLRPASKDVTSPNSVKMVNSEKASLPEDSEWASKELLEFVSHMRDGDTSVLSPYDVQPLLLEYIKRNKLRDPRKKSQIVCDSRLKSLFGKPRVGHFEMLKLLESHFLTKEEPSQGDESLGGITDTEAVHMEMDGSLDGTSKASSEKKRKKGKRTDEWVSQANLDDYAAIDAHNINLIYLKRNLMETLLDDMDSFQSKVVGAFVRIRISGSGQKQDMYRLVQVVGIGKAVEPYKMGRKTTDVTLEILNLDKTEIISIDTISNQEFSEVIEIKFST